MFLFRRGLAALLFVNYIALAFAQTGAPRLATFSGDFRLRYESYANAQTLNSGAAYNDRDYYRARLRLAEDVNPYTDTKIFVRIAAEPRYWYSAAKPSPGSGAEWKYAIVDNLFGRWKTEVVGIPLVITVGRQDIQLDDQWLMGDGTPIEGSWTTFYDAIRLTAEAKDIATTFDVIVLNQRPRASDRFPVLGNSHDHGGTDYLLTEQDEKGVVLHAANKTIKGIEIDGYFIHKQDTRIDQGPTSKYKGDNARLETLGARIAGTPDDHWKYTAEAALQWGHKDDTKFTVRRDVMAYAGTAKLTYAFKDSMANQLTGFTEYLSGDKPGTSNKDEMFDILWGRYPRVGETWAVAYTAETNGRPAQYNNLLRFGLTWTIAPTAKSSISSTWCALYAPQATPTRASSSTLFTGSGHFRGNMFQVVAKYAFTKTLSGLAFAEFCQMGDFYAHRNTMNFLRTELMVAF